MNVTQIQIVEGSLAVSESDQTSHYRRGGGSRYKGNLGRNS